MNMYRLGIEMTQEEKGGFNLSAGVWGTGIYFICRSQWEDWAIIGGMDAGYKLNKIVMWHDWELDWGRSGLV